MIYRIAFLVIMTIASLAFFFGLVEDGPDPVGGLICLGLGIAPLAKHWWDRRG